MVQPFKWCKTRWNQLQPQRSIKVLPVESEMQQQHLFHSKWRVWRLIGPDLASVRGNQILWPENRTKNAVSKPRGWHLPRKKKKRLQRITSVFRIFRFMHEEGPVAGPYYTGTWPVDILGIYPLEKAHQRLTTKTSIIWIEQRLWITSREHVSSTRSPSTGMIAGVSSLKVTLRALRAFLSMTSCLPSTSISNSLGKKWTQKRNFPSSLANCWPSSEGPYAWLFTSSASSIFAIGLRRLVNL